MYIFEPLLHLYASSIVRRSLTKPKMLVNNVLTNHTVGPAQLLGCVLPKSVVSCTLCLA